MALRLAAVLKEKHLGSSIGKVKPNRAVAADQVARHTTTGAHAVDLMNADVGADIEFAPRFDEDRALCFVGKQALQRRPLVFRIRHGRGLFEDAIIEPGRLD